LIEFNKYSRIGALLRKTGSKLWRGYGLDLTHKFTFAASTSYTDRDGRTVTISGGDGAAMVADTHTLNNGDTFDNLITARLSESSNHQAREIASASAAITDMAESMEHVTEDALDSAKVAQQSLEIAQKGAGVVRNTISSMDDIRDSIQETSKRIKRLGESSQEIGDIVGLITEIADQTNILALNAAIQASTAGDAGRGFAVVADEVQRLAERAGNATKQIEGLVNTIQADTNEAVKSMETSTAGVVNGAKMAEESGVALHEIEEVSIELSNMIRGISDSAKQQSSVAQDVSKTMNVIQEITLETSEGTEETSASLNALNELSSDLGRSVSGFKLPSEEDTNVETVVLQG
jgi:twitching motility protein PilJ